MRGADEAAVVWRPFDLEDGVVHLPARPRQGLLQLGLVVDVARTGVLDLLREGRDDRGLDGLEAVLQVERGDRRLEKCSKDVPAPRDALKLVRRDLAGVLREPVAEPELLRDDCARLPGDDVRADLREPPFRGILEAIEDAAGDRELEHAVPEKLEALVGLGPHFGPRRVREDLLEPLGRELADQPTELSGPGAVLRWRATPGVR